MRKKENEVSNIRYADDHRRHSAAKVFDQVKSAREIRIEIKFQKE